MDLSYSISSCYIIRASTYPRPPLSTEARITVGTPATLVIHSPNLTRLGLDNIIYRMYDESIHPISRPLLEKSDIIKLGTACGIDFNRGDCLSRLSSEKDCVSDTSGKCTASHTP